MLMVKVMSWVLLLLGSVFVNIVKIGMIMNKFNMCSVKMLVSEVVVCSLRLFMWLEVEVMDGEVEDMV